MLQKLPKSVDLSNRDWCDYLAFSGFSGVEPGGIWTDGPNASIRFIKPEVGNGDLLLMFYIVPCLSSTAASQIVNVAVNGLPAATWKLADPFHRWLPLVIDRAQLRASEIVTIGFSIPNCVQPSAAGASSDQRFLGIMLATLVWEDTSELQLERSFLLQLGRQVGEESRKSYDRKILSGFFSRYVNGPAVLDIGFEGKIGSQALPIFEGAIGVDLNFPGYDGRILPFDNDSQDAVYSSHCLEHIPDHIKAIQEWHRVTKVGGHIITVVPHCYLYERRKRPPSQWAGPHHVRFYTPMSLLAEFEAALPPNSYRVRHLADNDCGYEYDLHPSRHPGGCYEIELVVEKIRPPAWAVEE